MSKKKSITSKKVYNRIKRWIKCKKKSKNSKQQKYNKKRNNNKVTNNGNNLKKKNKETKAIGNNRTKTMASYK